MPVVRKIVRFCDDFKEKSAFKITNMLVPLMGRAIFYNRDIRVI